jgi:lipopolysaccharide transport system permease protein
LPPAEQSVLIIGPSNGGVINLRELWGHRELLYYLTWRDIAVRYKQTLLGVAWAVLQPVLTMVVFTLLFGVLARMPSAGIPYVLFSYTALLPWTYFANALGTGSNSLANNAHLIDKVYFPRMLLPLSASLAGLVDYAIAFAVLLVVLMPVYGLVPPLSVVFTVPLLTLLTSLLALGASLWLSALNVRYRDVRHVLPFIVQLWMFATPVVYPLSLVPERFRWVVALNPMAGVVEGYRSALLGTPWDLPSLGVSLASCAAVLLSGAWFFCRVEDDFADII